MVSLALICSFSRVRAFLGLGKIRQDDIPHRVLKSVAEILRKSDFLKVSDDGKPSYHAKASFCSLLLLNTCYKCGFFFLKGKRLVGLRSSQSQKKLFSKWMKEQLQPRLFSMMLLWKMWNLSLLSLGRYT